MKVGSECFQIILQLSRMAKYLKTLFSIQSFLQSPKVSSSLVLPQTVVFNWWVSQPPQKVSFLRGKNNNANSANYAMQPAIQLSIIS